MRSRITPATNPSQHENNTTQTHLERLVESAGRSPRTTVRRKGRRAESGRRAGTWSPAEGRANDLATLRKAKAVAREPPPRKAPPMSPAAAEAEEAVAPRDAEEGLAPRDGPGANALQAARRAPRPRSAGRAAYPSGRSRRLKASPLAGRAASRRRGRAGAEAFPPPPPPHPPIYFDVYTLDGGGKLFGRLDLSGAERLTFGRDAHVDVPLDHVSISRHHATIRFEGGVTYVADMKSTTVPSSSWRRTGPTSASRRRGSARGPSSASARRRASTSSGAAARAGCRRPAPLPRARARPEEAGRAADPEAVRPSRRGRAAAADDERLRAVDEVLEPTPGSAWRTALRAGPPPGPPPFEARMADRAPPLLRESWARRRRAGGSARAELGEAAEARLARRPTRQRARAWAASGGGERGDAGGGGGRARVVACRGKDLGSSASTAPAPSSLGLGLRLAALAQRRRRVRRDVSACTATTATTMSPPLVRRPRGRGSSAMPICGGAATRRSAVGVASAASAARARAAARRHLRRRARPRSDLSRRLDAGRRRGARRRS